MAEARSRCVLLDAGPLVAWIDRGDPHHARVKAFMDGFDGRLLSTWPVLTEACQQIPEKLVPRLMQWVARGGVEVVEMPGTVAGTFATRMEARRSDMPMDLADASLLWLAESTGATEVATLDQQGEGFYRTDRARTLRNVVDA